MYVPRWSFRRDAIWWVNEYQKPVVCFSLLSSPLILASSNGGFPFEAKIINRNSEEYMFLDS